MRKLLYDKFPGNYLGKKKPSILHYYCTGYLLFDGHSNVILDGALRQHDE